MPPVVPVNRAPAPASSPQTCAEQISKSILEADASCWVVGYVVRGRKFERLGEGEGERYLLMEGGGHVHM